MLHSIYFLQKMHRDFEDGAEAKTDKHVLLPFNGFMKSVLAKHTFATTLPQTCRRVIRKYSFACIEPSKQTMVANRYTCLRKRALTKHIVATTMPQAPIFM